MPAALLIQIPVTLNFKLMITPQLSGNEQFLHSNERKKISVIIVDDHQMIRQMWAKMFESNPKVDVIGQAGEFNEAIELIKAKRPNIVLLDINLAKDSGFDAVPIIRKFSPGTKIIAVTMHAQPSFAKKMLQLGAKGYITKNSSHLEMIKAIDDVMMDKVYICAEIKNILAERLIVDQEPQPDVNSLSVREMEIVKLMKDGLSSKEISAQLNISARTVEVHRHNVLKKLNFKNTAALVNFINNSDLNFN